jgi:hypothetical protein
MIVLSFPHSLFSHSHLSAKLILISTCITRLAKIILKNINVASMGFEPVTLQANVLVATTTPQVYLCQYLLQYYISPKAYLLPLHNV